MTADDLRDAGKDTVESGQKAAARVGDVVSDSASSLADKASDAASRVKSAASATYDKAKDQLPGTASDAVDAGKRAYADGSERLGRQVARQPIEALLLSGAIGYLVGWAANRS